MKINIKSPRVITSFKTEKIYPQLEKLTITPSIEEQSFDGSYGQVTIKGVTADIDESIRPENIKEGVNILGVDGGYEGIDTSDATATVEDVLENKTFYANNQKITGGIQEYDGTYSGNTVEEVKITDASYLFYKNARIDYLNEILSICENVTTMSNMFYECTISEIDLTNFDTADVTNMGYVFQNCKYLSSLNISNFNTSKVSFMRSMFYYCENLVTLNLSSFDMSNVQNVEYIFKNCKKLASLNSFKNLGRGYTQKSNNYATYKLDLSSSTKLTYESLMDIITNGLYDLNLTYDVANGGTLYRQSLVLGATNLAKLTEEEIAIATNKGWDVS